MSTFRNSPRLLKGATVENIRLAGWKMTEETGERKG